jgi:hypothetical protein
MASYNNNNGPISPNVIKSDQEDQNRPISRLVQRIPFSILRFRSKVNKSRFQIQKIDKTPTVVDKSQCSTFLAAIIFNCEVVVVI